MTYLQAAAAAAVFAVLSAWLLPALARRIPDALERQWRADAEQYSLYELGEEPRPHLAGYSHGMVMALGAVVCFAALNVYGMNRTGAAACAYFFALLLLLTINGKHLLLPDVVVLPTLWAALLFHTFNGQATEHVYSTAAAYGLPLITASLFQRFAGSAVLGHGDIKAFAMAGAWFGWAALPTLFGAFVLSIALHAVLRQLRPTGSTLLPTGPAHLAASVACMLAPQMF